MALSEIDDGTFHVFVHQTIHDAEFYKEYNSENREPGTITDEDLKKFGVEKDSRWTNEDSFYYDMDVFFRDDYEKFSEMWDYVVNKHPYIKDRITKAQVVTSILNETHQRQYDTNEAFYRGTNRSELDSYH